jgi:aryl-alcohol dehydrogenase-like predicted oxidoreductase
MKKTYIGKTDIEVSCLGLGTVKFGRNEKVHYPQAFALPSDKDIANLIDYAYDLGINLLDTAPAYGASEARLGKLLSSQRQRWILSTKVGEEFSEGESRYDFSAEHICYSVERSLTRLKTDYLDIVLVHSSGDDKQIIESYPVFATLEKLKQRGLIRAYGMSTKTVEGGLLALQHADLAMVMHNPNYTDEAAVIAAAVAQQKAIFVKKALASGHLDKFKTAHPVSDALNFVLNTPGVTSVILGTLSASHLRYNVDCAEAISA